MDMVLEPEAPPLHRDASGALRVGNSRVLVELVLRGFQDGATPEALAQRYAATTLADVYAVIAYYLRHRHELDDYLVGRERLAQAVRQRIEDRQGDMADVRQRLLTRQSTA